MRGQNKRYAQQGSDCHVGCCSNGLSNNKKRCTSFPGNPLLPRDSNAENFECLGGHKHGGRNKQKARRPAPSLELSTLSLTVSHLHSPTLCSSLLPSLFLILSAATTLFLLILTLLRLSNSPSHEWPKEEMCLCLDSRQIICGNKFLCVQCHVIGFISHGTHAGLAAMVYLTLYLDSWREDDR